MSELADYQRLRAVAAGQVEAIEADDLERFGRLSNARDALMERLQSPVEPAARAVATRLLREVAALDVQLQRGLRSGLETTRLELKQLRQGHRAVRAYASPVSTQGPGGRA